MSNTIAPGSSADVNVKVTALTTNPNVPVTYKTIILKKNLVNGVNTLMQDMVSANNIKYVIKYDYVLGEDINVPANCVLEFDGGCISGEHTINGTNTGINAELVKIFNTDVILAGTWNIVEAYPEWFGAKGDGVTDDTVSLQKVLDFCVSLIKRDVCLSNKYKVTSTLYINRIAEERGIIKISGGGQLIASTEITVLKATNNSTSDIQFSYIRFYGNGVCFDLEKGKLIRLFIDHCTFNGFVHSFYSSTYCQDIHIKNCLFFNHTDYVFYTEKAYTTTIETCIAEVNNFAFAYIGNGAFYLVGNTLEGFTGNKPVVHLVNGRIVAIDNFMEYNTCNFLTLGASGSTIYGCIISNNTETFPQSQLPSIIIDTDYQDGIISIFNNNTTNPVFQNDKNKKVLSYSNSSEGIGNSFGKTLFNSPKENIVNITPTCTLYSRDITILNNTDVCKIETVDSSIYTLTHIKITGTLYNVGKVYYEATYLGSTEVSKIGSESLLSLVKFENGILSININGGMSKYSISIEINGKSRVTEY